MQIAGIQKTTLVDYPGKVAATVFTRGCSFRCPFCHNPELVIPERFNPVIPTEEIFEFLASRQGKLQGVCITGGEPTLHADIGEFIREIKNLGFAVKLDTNGSYPDRLEELIKSGNINYIAMDIKAPLDKYLEVAKVKSQKSKVKMKEDIKKSISLIMNSGIDYEFRTTVCHPIHTPADFESIGKLIAGAKRYYIQNFVRSKHNDETINYQPFNEKELSAALKIVAKTIQSANIR